MQAEEKIRRNGGKKTPEKAKRTPEASFDLLFYSIPLSFADMEDFL